MNTPNLFVGMMQTMQVPKESNTRTLRELNAQLAVAMGGTAAEELIFGPSNITTGTPSPPTILVIAESR